jgi:predicted negative regulator of RcsB-dependent stress response
MENMKKPQEGFSAVEALLILIIVAILGGVGWYVWHANNEADKNLTSASNTSSLSNKTDKSNGYFVIKEWNVRAKNSYGITPLFHHRN